VVAALSPSSDETSPSRSLSIVPAASNPKFPWPRSRKDREVRLPSAAGFGKAIPSVAYSMSGDPLIVPPAPASRRFDTLTSSSPVPLKPT